MGGFMPGSISDGGAAGNAGIKLGGGKPCPTCGQPMKGGGASMETMPPGPTGPIGQVDPAKGMPGGNMPPGNQPPPWRGGAGGNMPEPTPLGGGMPPNGGFVPPSLPKPPPMPQPGRMPQPGNAGPYGGFMGGQNRRGPGGFGRTPGGAF